MEQRYVALVPVKPPALGKSRLVGLADDERRELAAAFALDTVAACMAASSIAEVLVVTDDAAFSVELADLGAHTIPDGVAMDLNETLRQSAAEARRRWPALVPVALTADLPAVRATDLDDALGPSRRARRRTSPTPTGSAPRSTRRPTTTSHPRFGPGSALAHDAMGARLVGAALPRLRRDVDNLADLDDALALGVGPRTAERAASLSQGGGPCRGLSSGLLGGLLGRCLLRGRLLRRCLLRGRLLGRAFFAGAFLAGAFLRAPSSPVPSWPAPSWPVPSSRRLLGRAFFAGAFFAGAFFAGAFLAGAFFAGAFLAGAFLARSSWSSSSWPGWPPRRRPARPGPRPRGSASAASWRPTRCSSGPGRR